MKIITSTSRKMLPTDLPQAAQRRRQQQQPQRGAPAGGMRRDRRAAARTSYRRRRCLASPRDARKPIRSASSEAPWGTNREEAMRGRVDGIGREVRGGSSPRPQRSAPSSPPPIRFPSATRWRTIQIPPPLQGRTRRSPYFRQHPSYFTQLLERQSPEIIVDMVSFRRGNYASIIEKRGLLLVTPQHVIVRAVFCHVTRITCEAHFRTENGPGFNCRLGQTDPFWSTDPA